jgi:hypothetical protein
MKQIKILFILFLLFVFFLGMYLTMYNPHSIESMETEKDSPDADADADSSCPDLLIQKGNELLLYNTKQPIEGGKNPIPFFNLDEYINYLEIQRKRGIVCPILFLQQETNAQGEDIYRMRPSPFDLQGGLPQMTTIDMSGVVETADASRDNPPYNSGNYPGFDPQGLYVGVYTDLDKMHHATSANEISDNPMDPNWAGTVYTQQMIDSGKYEENNITNPVLFTPKTAFYPTIKNDSPPPIDVL